MYYDYNSDNQLGLVRDEIQNTRTRYTYDLAGRLIKEEVRQNSAKDNGDLIRSTVFAYEDGTNRLISRKDVFAAMPVSTGYVYGNTANGEMADSIYGVTLNGYNQITYTYDSLGRKSSRTLNASGSRNVVTEYSYLQGTDSGKTTTLLDTVTQDGVVTQYAYDEMGSITQISEDGVVKRNYTYDALNQLTSETRDGITETYAYDNGGNILSRTRGGVTDTWSYESTLWKDLLTSYNGQAITYDEIGNPLTYRDGMTMTWQNGRRLSTLTKGSDSISYTYNADGIRTSKTVNGQTTEYILDGSTILGEKLPDGEYLYYLFDENGVRYGFARGSMLYYYVCNAQGDVIKILTSGGATAAWYEYDAWGNVVSIGGNADIANLNPIRYRGYYYDAETGFYYLNSRYYDPEICRFVNADGYVSTGSALLGYNMFAYCLSDPISNVDSSGSIPMQCKFYSDGSGTPSVTPASSKKNDGGFFGAGADTVFRFTEKKQTNFSVADIVTITSGKYSSKKVNSAGNSTKPISVYAQGRADNWLLSSAGIKINVNDFTLNISVGMDNIGITGYVKDGNITNSFGIKANFSEFKVGFEGSTIVQWDDTNSTTTYQNASIGMGPVIAVVVFAQTGQWALSPAY